jgi:hypothetical protein
LNTKSAPALPCPGIKSQLDIKLDTLLNAQRAANPNLIHELVPSGPLALCPDGADAGGPGPDGHRTICPSPPMTFVRFVNCSMVFHGGTAERFEVST